MVENFGTHFLKNRWTWMPISQLIRWYEKQARFLSHNRIFFSEFVTDGLTFLGTPWLISSISALQTTKHLFDFKFQSTTRWDLQSTTNPVSVSATSYQNRHHRPPQLFANTTEDYEIWIKCRTVTIRLPKSVQKFHRLSKASRRFGLISTRHTRRKKQVRVF